MKIQTNELLDSLLDSSLAVTSKKLIFQSSCFAFKDKNVHTFNGDLAVKAVSPIDFEGTVPAKEFLAVLSKYKNKEIDIKSTDKELIIQSGKSKSGISISKENTLPMELFDWESEFIVRDLPDTLIQDLNCIGGVASKDFLSNALSCVHFTDEKIEACDGHRIARRDIKCNMGDFLLPIESIPSILKFEPKCIGKIDKHKDWIIFEKDHTLLYVRLVHGEFPNLENIIEKGGQPILFPMELKEALDKAIIFSGKGEEASDKFIVMIDRMKIKIRSENDCGWHEEIIPFDYSGDPVSFNTNPNFLKDFIVEEGKVYLGERMIRFSKGSIFHCCSIEKK